MKNAATEILQSAGVTNLESIDLDDDEQCRAIGSQIQSLIRDRQRPDFNEELKEMGMPMPGEREADTVAEYRDKKKGFVIAKATSTGKIRTLWGSQLHVCTGMNYCMSAPSYLAINKAGCRMVPSDVKFNDRYRQYHGENLDGKKLFVWRSGGLGDLMFIHPLLATLKERYDCEIMFGTSERYHPLVSLWPDVIDASTNIPFVPEQTLDITDYHVTFEGLIERCADAQRLDVHDMFAEYMCVPGEIDWCRPLTPVSSMEVPSDEYVAVQVRASAQVRTPYPHTIVDAVDYCTDRGLRVVLCDSENGRRDIAELRGLCRAPHMVSSSLDITNGIIDAIKLITHARMVIAPDSSFVHFAAAQDVPCVGLYGPFPAHVRTKYYPKCFTVETDDPSLECGGRECFKHAHTPCPISEVCWGSITKEAVRAAIDQALEV